MAVHARLILPKDLYDGHSWPADFEVLPQVGHRIRGNKAVVVVTKVEHAIDGIELHCEAAKDELLG